jgi:hypothetical protein
VVAGKMGEKHMGYMFAKAAMRSVLHIQGCASVTSSYEYLAGMHFTIKAPNNARFGGNNPIFWWAS